MNVDVNLISKFSTSGIYTLLLLVPKEVCLSIGKLGEKRFPRGYYTYTGSALGKGASNLKHRIARHLRKEKQKFWHIDYLLANENVSVETVVAAETREKIECTLNQHIKNALGGKIQVEGFGASDCRKNCGSHLLYFPYTKKADLLIEGIVDYLKSSAGVLSVSVIE